VWGVVIDVKLNNSRTFMSTFNNSWREAALSTLFVVCTAVHGQTALTQDARAVLNWIRQTGNHGSQPFVVIDKRAGHLWLFDGATQPVDDSAVLLGLAQGDHSVPGIGDRPLQKVLPHERTTPAGRFVMEAGRNTQGEDVMWIDYDAAVSMHRVRTHNPAEQRTQRLASPTGSDNRISYGCVNVPAIFYDQRLMPTLKTRASVVYVLPEKTPWNSVFK
jgi:hypothetical protein